MEEHANLPLRALGHAEMIDEELVAIRLYTGPMYVRQWSVGEGGMIDEELVAIRLYTGPMYTSASREASEQAS